MKTPDGRPIEWYSQWFDSTYQKLYRHRDWSEARCFVDWMRNYLSNEASEGVLDLCCGAGRHAWLMASLNRWPVVGLDLSRHMLTHAIRENQPPGSAKPQFVQGDLRCLPFAPGSFGMVAVLFTSFGYFATDREHLSALEQIQPLLRPGGVLLLDLHNLRPTLDDLVQSDETEIEGARVIQTRSYDRETKRIEKRIEIQFNISPPRVIRESVRIFAPDEIDRLIRNAGFSPAKWIGSYSGDPFLPASSERMILIARTDA